MLSFDQSESVGENNKSKATKGPEKVDRDLSSKHSCKKEKKKRKKQDVLFPDNSSSKCSPKDNYSPDKKRKKKKSDS
jgi:hypothetical protein